MQTVSEQSFAGEFMKILEIVLLTGFYYFVAFLLTIPDDVATIAIVGSLSGALILNYFRRENWLEMLFKTVCSGLAGLFIGGAVYSYFEFHNIFYTGCTFFLAALLSLIILRAILSITESNAVDIVRQLLQRILNLQTKEEKDTKKSQKQ